MASSSFVDANLQWPHDDCAIPGGRRAVEQADSADEARILQRKARLGQPAAVLIKSRFAADPWCSADTGRGLKGEVSDGTVTVVQHGVSILRSGWSTVRSDAWIDLDVWRRLVTTSAEFEPTDEVPGLDPTLGRVVPQLWPNSAVWRGHPSGLTFVFLWRIGRLEVGALEEGGATYALPHFDAALQSQCRQIAGSLDAEVEDLPWPTEPKSGNGV
jgi:hypothetical protein